MMMRKALYGMAALTVALVSSVTLLSTHAFAADARNYNAGRIIDDAIFTNKSSMSVGDIQNFLNSKVPNCDNWGQKTSELGGGTRAQWLAAHGISTPITCLRDYYENPSTGANSYGKNIPAGAISAAQIIYNYAQQFNINPQVLLVTLQKENGLITDEWPTPKQFSEAMGFGCPDNVAPGAPACDPNYGSFSAQIYQSARHFRGYTDDGPGWWVPFTTGNNYIGWSPDANCGGSTINIENRSTVALYSYTPYRPNQAALNAQYGTGDNCSTYGNRNFYMYFTDWFGSTYGTVQITSPLQVGSETSQGLFTGMDTTAQFTIQNTSAQWQDIGSMAIAARDQNGVNFDFGLQAIQLAPYQSYTYRATRRFSTEGRFTFWITNYRSSVGWDDNYPASTGTNSRSISNKLVQAIPSLTQNISAASELRTGKSVPVGFSVKNNSAYPLNLGYMGIALRGPDNENADLPFDTISALAAGQTYAYTKNFTPKRSGNFTSYISSSGDNGISWNETSFPARDATNTGRATLSVKSSPTLTQGPTLDIGSPRAYQTVNASFKLKNYASSTVNAGYVGIAVRGPDGEHVDFGGVNLNNVTAGQEYTFSASRAFTKPGTYTAWITSTRDGGASWDDISYPSLESSNVPRRITFTVQSNPTLTQGPQLSITSPRAGQNVSATFKLKNYGDIKANAGVVGIAVRGPDGKQVDFGGTDLSQLAANQEYTFSASRAFTKPGTYTAWITSTRDGVVWNDTDSPVLDSDAVQRRITFTVQSNPTLTQGVAFSSPTIHTGEGMTTTFTVHNYASLPITLDGVAVAIRSSSGVNYDMPLKGVTIAAGQDYIYTATRAFDKSGTYTAWITSYQNGSWNDTDYPASDTPSVIRRATFTVL
jgi:hypothetical protein